MPVMKRNATNNKNVPAFIIECPKCGGKYGYADSDALSNIDISKPCPKCSFLVYDNSTMMMRAITDLLSNKDPKALEMIRMTIKDSANMSGKKQDACEHCRNLMQ